MMTWRQKNKHQGKTCPSMTMSRGARQAQQEPGRPVAHSLTGNRSIHQQEGTRGWAFWLCTRLAGKRRDE